MFWKRGDRRTEPRELAGRVFGVRAAIGRDSTGVDGRILDRSKSGLALSVPVFLMRGTDIQFTFEDGSVGRGQVEYCRQRSNGDYRVGVRIETQ